MTKYQMVADLAFKSQVLFWSSVVLGSMSFVTLGYAIFRYIGFKGQYLTIHLSSLNFNAFNLM